MEITSEKVFAYGPPTRSGKIPFTPPGTDLHCETAYWLWGDLSTNVPLIVLHGGPGATGRDLKTLSSLSKIEGIPVLHYDQIGCGESTHLPERRGDRDFWKIELFLAELNNVKKYLEITQYDLLGHSCGGMIAITHTLTQPPGLRKLIMASSFASETLRAQGFLDRRNEFLTKEQLDIMSMCEQEDRTSSPEYRSVQDQFGKLALCRLNPWPVELKETIALMEEDDTVMHSLYGPVPFKPTGSWTSYDVVDRLSQISEKTTPGGVLLTNGCYDVAGDKAMTPFFQRIRARVKWIRFAESAHFPHIEEAQAYVTALAGFLKLE